MKNILFYLLMLCSISTFAQKGITFEVEKLSPPKRLLPIDAYDNVYKNLILHDISLRPYEIEEANTDIPFDIIAKSKAPDSLVTYKYNSFFYGMYEAYANHRPFVLSPDMIWILISQGFARHVNANQESMRNLFVNFSGKRPLIIETDKKLEGPTLAWEEIFPKFTRQIKNYTGNELIETLTCNFSTTTLLEKVASEITIMEAMKPYFEFIVMRIICGIPEITLEGTPEDWEKVLDKAQKLKEYKLEWWISELEPLLEEFIKASKGDVNKEFWRNMFKYHSLQRYGAPKIIDGWIVKFFPYNKDGKRNNLKQLEGGDNLPDEIVKVDLKYLEVRSDTIIETPLELWSGFIGLKQNKDNFALRPQIGWMIRKKDVENKGLTSKLAMEAQGNGSKISITTREFPTALLGVAELKRLEIHFTDHIDIPDELSKVRIERLELFGRITKEETVRIKKLLPDTDIKINGSRI